MKQAGTWHVSSEVLKMWVNTGDSRSAQCFKVDGETESGAAALLGFCLLKSLLTSLSWIVRVVVGRRAHRCGQLRGGRQAPAEVVQ